MDERSGYPGSAEPELTDDARIDFSTQARHRRWLTLAVSLFLLSALISWLANWWDGYIDLQVYRNGARAWLDGDELYGPLPPAGGIDLPFTYPPLAALFFAPLALMPLGLAELVVLVTSVSALGITLWLVLCRLRPELDRTALLPLVIGAVAVTQVFEPLRQTFGFGQINLVLMAAVALDCLTRSPLWPRGLLIGVAASVKLVPAGFLLFFLLRRDWKAAGTLVISALGSIGIAYLLFPSDSTEYWFHKLADTGRIGPPHYAGNQSLKGFAFRLGVPDSAATLIWLGLAVVAVALAALWMHRLLSVDAVVPALLVNAMTVLLVSPVSWSHHWVWLAPALLVAADVLVRRSGGVDVRRAGRVTLGVVAVLAIMFLIGPQWVLPHQEDQELGWALWQQLLGSSYVLVAFGALVVAAFTYRPAVSGVRKAANAAA
ncbi:glycosyltransferase 87 family protein [Nocardia paucivorans]|uniref:glycosyltransferase 87 family protein n=1 Tax=Nocardia paucivorans TaxID=114259 RepID=UPI000A03382C|nr:glycosyltransferase 87 family protein [Nocardia paucivorans]